MVEDFVRAAMLIRERSSEIDKSFIGPLKEGEVSLSVERAKGLAIWSQREAYVEFFASKPAFDADLFRRSTATM